MPAIRYSVSPGHLTVVNHYSQPDVVQKIWLKGTHNEFITGRIVGFICVAGSNYFRGARLGKLLVRDITNGYGENCEWRTVAFDEYVYAMVLPGDEFPICRVLIGDEGWPITTLDEFRNFPKCLQSIRPLHIYRPKSS